MSACDHQWRLLWPGYSECAVPGCGAVRVIAAMKKETPQDTGTGTP